MKIAILSDIHDNIWNLEKALDELKGKVEKTIYLGDFCAPFIPPKLSSLGLPVYACLGNNDEDQIGLFRNGGKLFTWTSVGQQVGEVEIDERKIAYTHYPRLGELLAKSGEYDAVFHGHTHVSRIETHGDTLLVNPGAVCGIIGGKPGKASYAIYDTSTNAAKVITIK